MPFVNVPYSVSLPWPTRIKKKMHRAQYRMTRAIIHKEDGEAKRADWWGQNWYKFLKIKLELNSNSN